MKPADGITATGASRKAHHGTEHFEIFLAALWRLVSNHNESLAESVVREFCNAAEHVGNWAPRVPAWFDYGTGLFRSMHLGTEIVNESPGEAVNIPEHFRCINLALIAHDMTGEQRYLDLAQAHAQRWAQAILDCPALPQAIDARGAVDDMAGDARQAYWGFVGQAGDLSLRVDRAENLVCSDAITTLLRLWQLTGNQALHDAAVRVLDELATQLPDPDAGVAADALRRYRRMTGDTRYDQTVRDALTSLCPDDVQGLTLVPEVKRNGRPTGGVGKRGDMPEWYEHDHENHENNKAARYNPILLAVAAEIERDDTLWRTALDLRACALPSCTAGLSQWSASRLHGPERVRHRAWARPRQSCRHGHRRAHGLS